MYLIAEECAFEIRNGIFIIILLIIFEMDMAETSERRQYGVTENKQAERG